MDDDVYLKYRPTNSDWVLSHRKLFTGSVRGIYDSMVDTMNMHCVGVSVDVAADINQFKGIDSYYVRRSIRSNAFFKMRNVITLDQS